MAEEKKVTGKIEPVIWKTETDGNNAMPRIKESVEPSKTITPDPPKPNPPATTDNK